MAAKNDPKTSGRFAYGRLERVIHEKARLSIMASLASHRDGLLFADLKELCALTDGNLSRHLSVLERSKMIESLKQQDQSRPQTLCRITASGRNRYLAYLSTLERVIQDATKETKDERTGLPRVLRPSQA